MKECTGAVGTLADKRSEVPRMDETQKLHWLCCGGFSSILSEVQIYLRNSFQGWKN